MLRAPAPRSDGSDPAYTAYSDLMEHMVVQYGMQSQKLPESQLQQLLAMPRGETEKGYPSPRERSAVKHAYRKRVGRRLDAQAQSSASPAQSAAGATGASSNVTVGVGGVGSGAATAAGAGAAVAAVATPAPPSRRVDDAASTQQWQSLARTAADAILACKLTDVAAKCQAWNAWAAYCRQHGFAIIGTPTRTRHDMDNAIIKRKCNVKRGVVKA